MTVKLVVVTTYAQADFQHIQFPVFARKYPQLCFLGVQLQDMPAETILQLVAGSHLTHVTTPQGVVIMGSVTDWTTSLPVLLTKPETKHHAAKINALLAKMGLSLR